MRNRRCRFHRTLILACFAACTLSVVGQASNASMEDVIQAVHSFQQLAVLDLSAVGDVWMEGRSASGWRGTFEGAIDDLFEATILFGHMIPLATADETGVRAALYNPWVGMLLLLSFDPLATLIESYSIHPAEPLGDEADSPLAFATVAMSAIDSVVATFDAFKDGSTPGDELSAKDLGQRVDEAADRLAAAYGSPEAASDEPLLANAIDLLFAEELEEPLTLLEAESYDWINSLLPLWTGSQGSTTYVVLASMESPLDWTWLEIGDDADRPIDSVSVIRLYDRIVTQRGDAS